MEQFTGYFDIYSTHISTLKDFGLFRSPQPLDRFRRSAARFLVKQTRGKRFCVFGNPSLSLRSPFQVCGELSLSSHRLPTELMVNWCVFEKQAEIQHFVFKSQLTL